MHFALLFLLFARLSPASDTLYNISFNTFETGARTMQEFQGRRIMIVVLPVTMESTDSATLRRISAIAALDTSLVIIAVPSFDDGLNRAMVQDLFPFYRRLASQDVIITRGMHTRKGMGDLQHPLFAWLTNADQNGHFNDDVEGTGHCFFINEQGELYAAAQPGGLLSNKFVRSVLQKP